MVLILHIGLPKTGSTFLQKEVFPRIESLSFFYDRLPLQRYFPNAGKNFRDLIRDLIHSKKPLERMLGRWIVIAIARRRKFLLTNENISIKPHSIWRRKGHSPDSFFRWLNDLKRSTNRPVKLIFGIRRWDDWFASRYAQSAPNLRKFGQADFERRLAKILGQNIAQSTMYGWLDYRQITTRLHEILGEENVLVYRLEDLAEDPLVVVRGVFDLVEEDLPSSLAGERFWRGLELRNVRQRDPGKWKMRTVPGEITLSAEMRTRILDKFGDYESVLVK